LQEEIEEQRAGLQENAECQIQSLAGKIATLEAQKVEALSRLEETQKKLGEELSAKQLEVDAQGKDLEILYREMEELRQECELEKE
jgi:hypothetical protein